MPFIGNQPALSYTSFAKQDFTTSATTSYTLDNPVANENEIALFINFVRQEPTTAYTASGTSLTLTSATSASDDMYCVYLGKAVQTVNPPNGSVGLSQLTATGTKDSTTFLRGDNTFDTPPLGGITSAQEFRLAADQTGSASAGAVLTNWEENDTDYQAIGSAWSQSSGVFSCSSTGIYLCHFRVIILGATANDAFDPNIQISTDSGSNYNTRATAWEYVSTTDTGSSPSGFFMFDVANTSTFRLRFRESGDNDIGTTTTIKGDSSSSETNIIFTRLGDT